VLVVVGWTLTIPRRGPSRAQAARAAVVTTARKNQNVEPLRVSGCDEASLPHYSLAARRITLAAITFLPGNRSKLKLEL
jgi:hypothetical protein